MDHRLREWKAGLERILSAGAPHYGEAAALAAAIAEGSEDTTLRQAATQALPALRHAALDDSDRAATNAARRRLAIIHETLDALIFPRFGQRTAAPKLLTVEEQQRQMLGLPQDRRLSAPEIHQAFKHAAKTVHPDAGGSAQAFLELSAARDSLIRHSGRGYKAG
jgi:hypothetical protein